jgi:hypothetical protein
VEVKPALSLVEWIRFQQKNGAWSVTARACVDENRKVGLVHQCVCQIEAANAEVFDDQVGRKGFRGEPTRYFYAEAVIAEEDISDARY